LDAVYREFLPRAGQLIRGLELSIENFRESLNDNKNPLKMLIRDLLAIDPSQRPTAKQAFDRLEEIIESLCRERTDEINRSLVV
jgi:hypothetical protein